MILQSLTKLYNDLLLRDEISRPGWSDIKVGFALCIDETGKLTQIVPLITEIEKNGKTSIVNQTLRLPAQTKRSSGISANFLCDNSLYMLGIDNKGKPERSIECHLACKKKHEEILKDVPSKTASAILAFFENWNPKEADNNEVFAANKVDLLSGKNLIFRVNGKNAHEDPEIINAWQIAYGNSRGKTIRCLVTGEKDLLELTHPSLKGVEGAQSSGASLVSFNADAFCSFRREQGENAPIGKKAAFAYTTALNYLLADRDNVQHIGDTTVVCWADGAEKQYRNLSLAALFGTKLPAEMDESTLRAVVKQLSEGIPCEEFSLLPETRFYILGLAPNASRLSVRFFYVSSFGELMKNVNAHHERMRIIGNRYEYVPLWALLRETVNSNSKDKSGNPILSGAVARSIITGSLYPAGLLEATTLRIRAEHNITPVRAAIIKAYYIKNTDHRCPKEVLTVSLNENSTNIPYTLGRLFAVYEAAQQKANPGINTTIKDKYFNSVAATPAHILPTLNNLYHKHLRKMDSAAQIYFEKQVGALMSILGEELPLRLSLPEQGAFQLGYYHQQEKRFEKKEN